MDQTGLAEANCVLFCNERAHRHNKRNVKNSNFCIEKHTQQQLTAECSPVTTTATST